jgi:lipoprotein-anchoring transpeptidase ErfK/SrfK
MRRSVRHGAAGRVALVMAPVMAPVVALVLVLVALAACTTTGPAAIDSRSPAPSETQPSQPNTPSDPPSATESTHPQDGAPPAAIATVPASAIALNPITPIKVVATGGTLTSVTLTNPQGKVVTGAISDDGTSWQNTEVLGYSKTYTLSATAVNPNGVPSAKTASFTTLTPGNMTMPYLNTTAGYPLENGATYGVGIVPVVHFDEHIPDKAAAERALHVTTTPHVDGSWYWIDDKNVHWRPKDFYASGTKVTVSADVYGVEVGPGLYGQSDVSLSFTIGEKHVSIADDKTHQVYVYFSDKLVRTMPTSMGQGGWVQGTNGKISLWTMPGTYTVIGHENPAIMSSASYGLPADSPYGYAPEKIYWSTKISTDGIYLHQLDSTVWAQGSRDLSHGCLNLNLENAKWFYQHSLIGDVVQVKNTGGPPIEVWQNGDWSVPWDQWVARSALH